MLDLLKTFAAKGGAPAWPLDKRNQQRTARAAEARAAQAVRWPTSKGERTIAELYRESEGLVKESTLRSRLKRGVYDHAALLAPVRGWRP